MTHSGLEKLDQLSALEISPLDHLNAFRMQFKTNLKVLRGIYGVRSIELIPALGSPLSLLSNNRELPLTLPTDDCIGCYTFLNGNWDIGKVNFFSAISERISEQNICLIDVGANVGLFSRQCASKIPSINEVFAYEPHCENFEILRRNLADWNIRPRLINAGISNERGTMDLFEDATNCGNYSFNLASVPPQHQKSAVEVLDGADEEIKWLSSADGKAIFYKSDTQGFDELIATRLSMDFWNRVTCAAIELVRIKKPTYDIMKLREIIDQFSNCAFDDNIGKKVSSAEVIEYLNSEDGAYKDLLMWR